LAGAIVVASGPVGLLLLDIGLDLGAMEEPVLAGNLRHFERVLEDRSPVLNDLKISLEFSKLLTAADCIWKKPDKVAEIACKLHHMEALDVVEGRHGIHGERLQIGHATFELSTVIIARETLE